jgi:hypothetical protein
MAAREFHRFLVAAARRRRLARCLAHHADDQAELVCCACFEAPRPEVWRHALAGSFGLGEDVLIVPCWILRRRNCWPSPDARISRSAEMSNQSIDPLRTASGGPAPTRTGYQPGIRAVLARLAESSRRTLVRRNRGGALAIRKPASTTCLRDPTSAAGG